jgi:signal peptidase I
MGAFFVLLPLAGAIALVVLIAPADSYVATGTLGTLRVLFRDQRVPVGIVLFTVLEVTLWSRRHWLPGSAILTPLGRRDVPPDMRTDFERATALAQEADLLIERNRREVERELSAGEREDLTAALDELKASMRAEVFDEARFTKALSKADAGVDAMLGRWRKGELREYTESIGVAVAVALLLRVFIVEAFKIPSGSMIPTLQVGDHIFVNKWTYGPTIPWTRLRLFPRLPPKRGDVMVFEFPENREQDFIKRVIATPGDRLEVKDGHPVLNGWRVPYCTVGTYTYRDADSSMQHRADLAVEFLEDKSYLTLYERTWGSAETQGPYLVKPGEVWVLGDNRNNSHDSRGWYEGKGGGVPFANIKGRAMFVWLSFRSGSSDFAWERLGVDVMGMPKLPKELAATLGPGVEKCIRERPPLSETTPPPPR